MDTPKQWPQSYRDYAGFDTETMRQRARDAGCVAEEHIELWLYLNFGNDQAREMSPILGLYQRWERKKKALERGTRGLITILPRQNHP